MFTNIFFSCRKNETSFRILDFGVHNMYNSDN